MEASGHHEKAENLIREADGLGAISPHWFRHKYATDDIEDGGNISHTQANLGHSSLSTTSIYVHADMTKRVETSAKKRKLS
ncbi:Tyrosine recombinase XerC [compost metagenome]